MVPADDHDLPPDLEGLGESGDAYRLLVESVSDYAIYLLDPQGHIASWNPGAERIKGYSAPEVLGRHVRMFYRPTDAEAGEPERLMGEALRHGRVEAEGVRVRRDGSEFDALLTLTALFEPRGRHVGYAKVTRDITERKRAEAELRASEDRLRRLIKILPDALFINCDNRLVYCNPSFVRLVGAQTSVEVLGRTPLDFFQPAYHQVIKERIAAMLAGNGSAPALEERVLRLDGQLVPVEAVATSIMLDGRRSILVVLHDLTQRKTAEARQRSLDERLRLIIENVKDYAIFLTDSEGHISTWNVGAERLFGYTSDQAMGRPYHDLFAEDERQAGGPQQELEVARRDGKCVSEGWRLRQDGRRFWCNGVLNAVFDESGQFTGYCKVARDLTELRKREILLNAILESTLDGIICIDQHGTIELFNRAAERILGYSRHEVLGKNLKMLMPRPHSAQHDDYLKNYLETGEAKIIGIGREVEVLRKDGGRTPVDLSVTEFQTEADGLRRFAGVIRDLTTRKQAEEEQARLVSLLHATPDFVVIADVAGRVIFLNEATQRHVKQVRGEVPAELDLFDLHPATDADRLRREALPAALERGSWLGESAVNTVTGDRQPVSHLLLAHRSQEGEVRYLSCVLRDLTELRKLERQLRQSQKMEAIGQLAGGVAHDFNNLLTVILGYTSMILAKLTADDRNYAPLEAVRDAGNRAAALTRQLLAFGRRTVVQNQVVCLNDVIVETEKMLRRLIGEDIALQTQLADELESIEADPTLLGQVIMNLAINARDAMPRGGCLTLATGNRELAADELLSHDESPLAPGCYEELTVADTGQGMSPAVQSRIFEPFFTTKDVGHGTGLGLSVVLGIIQQARGAVTVETEPNRGSTFRVFFPIVVENPTDAQPAERSPSVRGNETVLIVEDEPSVRRLAAEVLTQSGYHVIVAPHGDEALSRVDELSGAIDLLVTDVIMPGLGATELAAALRSKFPRMRVLYTSGYSDELIVRRGIQRGDEPFLDKPYTPDALAKAVREVLDAPRR